MSKDVLDLIDHTLAAYGDAMRWSPTAAPEVVSLGTMAAAAEQVAAAMNVFVGEVMQAISRALEPLLPWAMALENARQRRRMWRLKARTRGR